jgi:hypothetical protein
VYSGAIHDVVVEKVVVEITVVVIGVVVEGIVAVADVVIVLVKMAHSRSELAVGDRVSYSPIAHSLVKKQLRSDVGVGDKNSNCVVESQVVTKEH